MIIINPGAGKRILIVEREDLKFENFIEEGRLQQVFESARAFFDMIVVISPTSRGRGVLPKWMRVFPLSPERGELGTSYWKMEKDEIGEWKK